MKIALNTGAPGSHQLSINHSTAQSTASSVKNESAATKRAATKTVKK